MRRRLLNCGLAVSAVGGYVSIAYGDLMTTYSTNWSGYTTSAPSNEQFTNISAEWTVPTVVPTTGKSTASAFWVGFDGAVNGDGTVEQCGVSADESSTGQASYFAWIELYPAGSYNFTNLAIHPGDTVSAAVTYLGYSASTGNYTYEFSVQDLTDGQGGLVTSTTTTNDQRSTAEWIAEAPSVESNGTVTQVTLANYGNVTFTDDMAGLENSSDQSLGNKTLGSLDPTAWDMEEQNGTLISVTGVISGNETFSINYVPEPASLGVLFGLGVAPLLRPRRRARPNSNS